MPPKRPGRTQGERASPAPTDAADASTRDPALGRPTPTRDQLPEGYTAFFAELSARVRAAQLKAAVAVNRELIALYWDLGREIVARQEREGWGAGVIARLSADLRREFPGVLGFSERNIRSARAFYLAYARVPANRQQPVAETDPAPPAVVAAIPWGHNLLLLEKLTNLALRLWYAEQTTVHGWSRSVLGLQIETALHTRLGRADQTTNFAATLPPAQSDLARAVVKDPYNFEFLTVAQDAHERQIEAGLVAHMRQFLLELGTGFLYAGNQYRLVVGGEEFFLDLLFYHKRLRCWVVLDLKMREFTPEYAGKMHFYLNVVDDQLRDAHDNPSIGLILCRSKNAVVAEYALRGVASPIGVAEYRVTTTLPAELRDALPSLEAVRAELEAAPLTDDALDGPTA